MAGTDVVIGAGGKTGRLICKELAALGSNVLAVVRDPNKYSTIFDEEPSKQNIKLVKGDMTDIDSLKGHISGARTVTYAAQQKRDNIDQGYAVEVEGLSRVCDLCKKEKVDRLIVISSMLVAPKDRYSIFRMLLNNVVSKGIMDKKFEGEEYVRKSGQPYTILRPATLTNNAGGTTKIHLRQDSNTPTYFISRHDVAIVAAAASNEPNAANKTIELCNDKSQPKNQSERLDQSYLSELFGNMKVDSEL